MCDKFGSLGVVRGSLLSRAGGGAGSDRPREHVAGRVSRIDKAWTVSKASLASDPAYLNITSGPPGCCEGE